MEQLKHECGVALIRLLKPLNYYVQKYGTWRYGLDKLYLLMEKQHNRGQEGAGVACVNLDAPAGEEYMFRERAEGKDAIIEVFKRIDKGEINDYTVNTFTTLCGRAIEHFSEIGDEKYLIYMKLMKEVLAKENVNKLTIDDEKELKENAKIK